MKKRISLLVIMAMIVSIIAATAVIVSADTPMVKLGGIEMKDGQEYNSINNPECISKGTVKLSGTTLYLNDATIKYDDGVVIDSRLDEITIVLTGTNTIEDNNDYCFAISGNNITIKGEGSLVSKGEAASLVCWETLTFDSAKVDANYVCVYSTYNEETKTITPGTINFNGASQVNCVTEEFSNGIYVDDEIFFNLTEGGKVYAKGTEAAVRVGSINTITLADNNVITLPTKGKVIGENTGILYIGDADGKVASEAVVEYVKPEAKKAGADTGDSNDIALFAIMGVMALAGAGVAMKRREN